jgi:hypothetical protein
LTKKPKEDLDRKFRHEALKHWEAHREAFEREAAFNLFRRKAILLVGLGCIVVAVIVHPYVSPLGAMLALLARDRP